MKTQVYNPYLPCYEYVPDGEPRIFDDRLYIVGSHDRFDGKDYCENDYVLWSTPLDDLSDWRYEGVIYRKDQDPHEGNLYAPDLVKGFDGRYYLYYSKSESYVISVAVCDSVVGEYQYLGDVKYKDGRVLGRDDEYYQFDPSILIDEDRIWLYSGSGQYSTQKTTKRKKVGCMVIELEQDMTTIKSEPKILLPGSKKMLADAFFEGASARKINGLYYLVFPNLNMTGLNYAVSRYPDRDFVMKGSIHSTSDVGINGHSVSRPAYPLGNNHGGLVNVLGQWYIFDHRMTNKTLFSRQGVAEPVTIEEDGSIRQVESTSCGLNNGPLKAEGEYPSYIACNLIGTLFSVPYITQDKPDGDESARQYVKDIGNSHKIGYKYFDITDPDLTIKIKYRSSGNGKLRILTQENGRSVGELKIEKNEQWSLSETKLHLSIGKSAVFFQYKGKGKVDLLSFSFEK